MFVIQYVPGLGWNISSSLYGRWEVKSIDGKSFEKLFPSKDEAISYLKANFGENVKYVESTNRAIRWPDD